MNGALEVLFTPAEFAALSARNLGDTVCVVFDILRATTTMTVALDHGAASIVPVAEIAEALEWRRRRPEVLLAGERHGMRIGSDLTGDGRGFDLGNSPREFTRKAVGGRTIVMTTTNGTRGLRACAGARATLAASFLNLRATHQWLERQSPGTLLLVCSGTAEEAAYEDVLAAGALCDLLWEQYRDAAADSALLARNVFRLEQSDLPQALARSRNGRRLMAIPELHDDVAFCAQRDRLDLVASMGRNGMIQKGPPGTT